MKTDFGGRKTSLCYLERDGKYLILHRTKKANDENQDKWIGVGGKFEPGETPDECALREVKEETGLTMIDYRLRGLIIFVSDVWGMEYMYLYTATKWRGEMIECDEGELVWLEKEELLNKNLWEGDKLFLRALDERDEFFMMKLRYEGEKLAEVVDSKDISAFRLRVYLELLNVPRGETITYGALARRIGCRSPQAVGQALRRNPFAPEIPCHRVIAADEHVLWCGKGRPTPFLRGFWPRMMAGCMAAVFLYWTFPDRVLAELAKGGENLSAFDVWPALVYSFFAAIDIWLLLTPLYYWILSLGTTWVVTNRSVTSFFGPFTHTWMCSEWLDPVRIETRENGCSDFLFMERGLLITMKNRGEVKVEAGIENVPPEDAKQLTAIFDSFQNKKSAMF